ncbi:DUF2097 domain-containing protein [Candidatus Methanosphaera massiliense]|jgi:hypothetical protein|uniref:DUF2097 domain-containing protein n=1 Tax=Methanosphaera TaxID=2316 RepID=UPI002380387F|nr:DUF2097 domain-containing protein [Candidatus Methanosphaera massiliense]MDD6285565.1 DUF2097 domain-containing protein [Methanobacteriaceae archaeon]MDE4078177.1 DUF2097 domain-containing protein [Candidatus Methanosphaera massiliense]MDY2744120.1 DUF2097 domain-containing protein [Methanosphaera sp.]
MKTRQITLHEYELVDYINDNFKENALLEISYNRVFIPGKILYIDNSDELIITLQLMGQLLHQTVDINVNDIIEEIVELRYTYEEDEIIISIVD